MRVDVMEHYGLTKPLDQAGYYETTHHRQILKDVKSAIFSGRLIAVCGVVGSGKTVTMRRLQQQLKNEDRIVVSKSLAVDKQHVKLVTLMNALFYDLDPGKNIRIPTQAEKRERELCALIKNNKRPVVLFVDEAHDLNLTTLIGLKRLMEVVEDGQGKLSIVLAGHPKLRNDLRRPTMEEIGYRTVVFTLDGISGSQREYILWLLEACTDGKSEPDAILTVAAMDMLASKLRTPLQVQQHLTLALETSYRLGDGPISVELLGNVLSKQLDEFEPTLVRNGYRVKDLVEQFGVKAAEVNALLRGRLDPKRALELQEKMLAAGLPMGVSA
jgi:type II secretory pathway predicted ATPase ExeA